MTAGRVSTFLFADLAGFTALTEAHGDTAAADLVDEFCAIVAAELAPLRGEQVKTIGDAVLARLDDAGEAVRLGLGISEAVRDRKGFPVVRVGMHTGSAVGRDGDWLGAGVNLAARVAAAASGNEVLISEATRDAAGDLPGIEFESRGSERFRHVGDPVRVFRVIHVESDSELLPIDPVCRMTVAPEHCAGHLVHDGAEYCFCSLECVAAFAADPARYVGETAR